MTKRALGVGAKCGCPAEECCELCCPETPTVAIVEVEIPEIEEDEE